jgi:hypothetical protein
MRASFIIALEGFCDCTVQSSIVLSCVYHPYFVTTDWLKCIKEINSTYELLTRHLLIEMHSRWLPHEAGWDYAKSVQKLSSWQTMANLKNLKSIIYLDLFNTFFSGYFMIQYVLFHSCDVFTIILQCRKPLNK